MKQSRKLPTPLGLCLAASFCMATVAVAQSGLERARAHQQAGQTAQLRAAVAEVLRQSPQDPAVLLAAAELLDLSGSPDRAQAYRRVLEAAPSPESREAKAARRRLILLYLQAGKYPQAQRELEVYHRAGGSDLPGWSDAAAAPLLPVGYIEIPGPLLPFQRMAAIRPQTPPEELLPALARNLVSIGYQYSHLYMKIAPTEYLKLLLAYLKQARELQALGDSDGLLSLNECEQAEPLLQILGYRLRGAGCAAGPKAGLEVDDPVRAFLTSDSAFPLVQLEEAIQGKRPFEHSVRSTQVPVLLGPEAWVEPGTPWIDALLEDRLLARFYVAVSCLPAHTLEALRQDATMEQLKPLSPVLDFFGRMLRVQGGSVVVPGGAAANQGWKGLADARPDRPGAFLLKLLEKDNGGWPPISMRCLALASPRRVTSPTANGWRASTTPFGARTPRPVRPGRSSGTAPHYCFWSHACACRPMAAHSCPAESRRGILSSACGRPSPVTREAVPACCAIRMASSKPCSAICVKPMRMACSMSSWRSTKSTGCAPSRSPQTRSCC